MLKKLVIASLFLSFVLLVPPRALARDSSLVTNWYIKDFQTEIVVNRDSTADITENITADCGHCVGKHGIYRIVPTRVYKSASESINTPVELISITDFSGVSYNYKQTLDKNNYAVSWKIGDADKTVTGVNEYRIKYKIKNVVRFDSPDFDEFYWNLLGNFWDLEIDDFTAKIIFPEAVVGNLSKVWLYSGDFKQSGNNLASYRWLNKNTLQVTANQKLSTGQGITASVTTAKNIFTPYILTKKEQADYSDNPLSILYPTLYKAINVIGLLSPLLVLFWAVIFWRKFGKDPKIKKSIVPEFEIPEKLAPIEMGMIESNGGFSNHFISSGIVNLAVKGFIKIEKIAKKGIFGQDDFELSLIKKEKSELTWSEKMLIDKLFAAGDKIKISLLKNKFYSSVSEIKQSVTKNLTKDNLLDKKGYYFRLGYIVLALILFGVSFIAAIIFPLLWVGISISIIILIVFAIIMPRRTLKNLNLWYRIQGFKLYMNTAEKYRQRFNEKENIFEKYLPYAILFNITALWIKKMEALYGKEYIAAYHPAWFAGGALASFNAESFDSALTQMSSSMASTLSSSPSSSGSGGGGFSGGGGGGGGGGGW